MLDIGLRSDNGTTKIHSRGKEGVSFLIDEDKRISLSAKDMEILAESWGLDSYDLQEFIDNLNEYKELESRIEILSNPQDYVFLESSDIYDMACERLGIYEDYIGHHKVIEAELDKIYENEVIARLEELSLFLEKQLR